VQATEAATITNSVKCARCTRRKEPSTIRFACCLDQRNIARVHGLNIAIPSKVLIIEGQNTLDTVDSHGRYQTRVMNLHSRDAVSYQKFAPLFVNRKAVHEQP